MYKRKKIYLIEEMSTAEPLHYTLFVYPHVLIYYIDL